MAQSLKPVKSRWTAPLLFSLLAVVLLTLNLRSAMASVSPIVPWISKDLSITPTQLGLLGMIPALCFSVAGLFSAALARKLGLQLCLLLSIVMMMVAHFLRSQSTSFAFLMVLTGCILLAAGIGGILLPPYIKDTFGPFAVTASSIYLCAISVSTALPPSIAAPVTEVFGWRASLNVWTLLAGLAAIPWAISWFRSRFKTPISAPSHDMSKSPLVSSGARFSPTKLVLQSRIFWGLALLHALNTFFTFTAFAWLPTFLVQRANLSAEVSGILLGLFAALTVPLALLVPRFMLSGRTDHWILHFFTFFLVSGWIGLWLLPHTAPWLWVIFISLGAGIFVVYQILLIQRTASSSITAAVSGYSQTFGYLIGGLGPLSIGMLHSWTGDWDAGIILLVAVACTGFVVGQIFRNQKTIGSPELAGPHPSEHQTSDGR